MTARKKAAAVEVLKSETGDTAPARELAKINEDLQRENDRLAKELAAAKARIKDANERACADKLQAVLEEHKCNLKPLPDGRWSITEVE